MLRQPLVLFTGCLKIQFFIHLPLLTQSVRLLWLPTPNCAVLVLLTGGYIIPKVI